MKSTTGRQRPRRTVERSRSDRRAVSYWRAFMQAALAISRRGRVFDLGLEFNSRVPHNPEFVRFAMAFTHTPKSTGSFGIPVLCGIDFRRSAHRNAHRSLIHVQKNDRIYGGHLAGDSRDDRAWKKYGIETVPPIVGRALCLDIPRLKGLTRLPDRYEVTIDDLKQELERAGREISAGDIVLVRTGKIQDFGDEAAFQAAEPGVGRDAALWLYQAGMAVLGTDTTGTEPLPFNDPAVTTHAAMLVECGVH